MARWSEDVMRVLQFGLVFGMVVTSLTAARADDRGNWPNWRGPDFNGIAVDANPPLTWS